MNRRRLDVGEIRIRPANLEDAEAIRDAHLDSILSIGPAFYPSELVQAWSAGLTPDLYINAMNGGEAFFVATGTLDDKVDVLGFSTHRIDDLQDGSPSMSEAEPPGEESAPCCCGRRRITRARTARAACRFRRRWPVWSSTG